MKLNILSSGALVLFCTCDVHSKDVGSKQQGIFDAMVDAAKAKVAGLPKYYSATDESDDDPSPSTFGTTLFAEVCENTPQGKNVFLSPLSVYKALALVKDGATIGSKNKDELEQLLSPPSLIEETEDEDKDVQLSIATSIWASDLKESYVEKAEEDHSAQAFPLPKRYTAVDDWIEEETNGMIKGFLGNDKVPGDISALLVNAVCFKGAWTYEFDPDKTVEGEFVLRDNSTIPMPAMFMSATRSMGYIPAEDTLGGATAVILDYGASDDEITEYTSLFILPASSEADSMQAVITGLTSQPISELVETVPKGKVWKTSVNLHLPRFKLEFGPESLTTALKNMGMEIAFDWAINDKFDEMANDHSLTFDNVLHGAAMEVTEKGTEAAAATVIPMRSRIARPRSPPQMTFDRPFVVAVIHRPTGEPVFIGRVEEPELEF